MRWPNILVGKLGHMLSASRLFCFLRLQTLKLLPLASRRTLFDVIKLYKCLNGFLKIDWSDFIIFHDTTMFNLRRDNPLLKTQYARTNTLKFSFFYRVVAAWNSLPLHIWMSDSLQKFLRLANAHLYEPFVFQLFAGLLCS